MMNIYNNTKFVDFLYEFWKRNATNICDYCSNNIICSEDCPKYESYGTNGTFIYCDGKEIPYESSYELSCMDVEFGKCPARENTPCDNCIESDISGFNWNNKIPESYDVL